MATGRIDAMVYALGMLAGLAVYAEVYPGIASWTKTTALGDAVWPDLLGLPRGLLVVIVALAAAALFYGATKVERAFADWRPAGTA
jgi:steroid 5-alpha reductase family enzyme